VDTAVIESLKAAGADTDLTGRGVSIPIQVAENGEVVPLGDEVFLLSGEIQIPGVKLRKIPELFTGNRQPPDFRGGPTEEYVLFFALIERMALDFCVSLKRIERDVEFERLYNLLRRRPDGKDHNPLFSYLQGVVRLYLSLRDVSQAEFEAVAARLAKSARTFSEGPTSRNYFEIALKKLQF